MPSADDTRNSETELKFEVDARALGQLRKHPALSAPAPTSRLRSVYYDTPRHDLRAAGVSLRVREVDGGFIQTVKTSEGPGAIARGEWETRTPDARPDPLALRGTPAAALLDGPAATELAEVFVTTVDRTVRLWRDGAAVVELSVDEGRIDAGGERESIREIELELKAGEAGDLFALARALAEAAPIRLLLDSKAERGYRLASHAATAALKAEPAALTPRTDVADGFRRIMRSCLSQVVGNTRLLRRAPSPQALHEARVGLRRLRAALTVFKPLVRDAPFDGLKAETKWLARELDQARDLDVLIARVMKARDGGTAQDSAIAAFGKRLLQARARAYGRAVAAIRSQRFGDLLLDLAAWIEVGAWSRDGDGERRAGREASIRDYGIEALGRLDAKVRKAGRHFGSLDVEGRHKLRIKCKTLRYAADFFGAAFPNHPGRRRRFVASLRRLQDCLGELNDIAVGGELARVAGSGSEQALTRAALAGPGRRKEKALIAQADAALKEFADLPRFWK